MIRKKPQFYTEEFRREAAGRSDQPGNTEASFTRELGIIPDQIYNWRRQFSRLSDKEFNSVDDIDCTKAVSETIRKLRREKIENEF